MIIVEKLKEYYDIGMSNDWDIEKISKYIDIPIEQFLYYVSKYIKEYKIVPTIKIINCFIPESIKQEIDIMLLWKIMHDKNKNILNCELKNIKKDIFQLFYEIDNEKDILNYTKHGISVDTIQKYSKKYIKNYISVYDFPEPIMMKICYDTCEKLKWDAQKLSYSIHLSSNEVRTYARKYIKEFLKRDMNEEQLNFFLTYNTKMLFQKYSDIIKLMKEENIVSQDQLNDDVWLNNNFRVKISEYCYNLLQKNDFNYIKLNMYCFQKNIFFENVANLSKTYISQYLSPKEREIVRQEMSSKRLETLMENQRHEKQKNPTEKMLIYDKLMKSSTEIEVIKIVESYSKGFEHLKRNISDCLIVHSSKYTPEQIKEKLKIYSEYLKKKRLEELGKQKEKEYKKYVEENLPIAQKMINEYLNNESITIQTFCNDNCIDIQIFQEYVNLIKQEDKELYNEYLNHNNNIKGRNFLILLVQIKKIIYLIKNGIEENGIKREFDLVDYYNHTKLTFEHLIEISKGRISAEDYKVLRKFIAVNSDKYGSKGLDLNKLYNEKTFVGVEFDNNGKIIEGSGREITKEEKMSLVNYLKSNNIPVTRRTYNIVYRRWLAGSLDIIQNETKKAK